MSDQQQTGSQASQAPSQTQAQSNPAETPLQRRGGEDFEQFLSTTSEQAGGKAEDGQKTPSKPASEVSEQQAPPASQVAAQQPAAPSAPSSTVSPELIEQIVSASVRGAQAAQQPAQPAVAQPEKELSEAEFNQKYGIVAVTPQHIAALLDQDPAKAASALNGLMTANMRSAVLMARDLFQAELSRMRGEVEPHLKSWQAHQAEIREQKVQDKFYKTYPDLSSEKDLVMEMKDALLAKVQAGQLRFNNEDEALKAVADASRKLLARMNRQAGAGTGVTSSQPQSQGQPPPSRQMTATSVAGQSGTGHTAGKSDEEKIFGAEYV